MQFLNVHLIYNSFTREDIKIFYPQMAEKKMWNIDKKSSH